MKPRVGMGGGLLVALAITNGACAPLGQGPPGGEGSAPSRSAVPTVIMSPPTSPAPSAAAPWWLLGMRQLCGYAPREYGCAGELASGTHTSGSLQPAITYTVPSGWVNYADWRAYFALLPDTPATRAGLSNYRYVRSIVVITDDVRVASTDCQQGKWEGGTSAAEIAAALATRDGLETTEPISVTVGELVGLQIDVVLEPGWTGTCPQDPTIPAMPTVGTQMAQGDDRHRLILLDEPDGGNIAILVYAEGSSEFEPFLAAAMPIVVSMDFVVVPSRWCSAHSFAPTSRAMTDQSDDWRYPSRRIPAWPSWRTPAG